MAKKIATAKKADKDMAKSPAAFASTDSSTAPSKNNPSKFSPTADAEMDIQALDPSDGLLKLFTDSIKDIYWAEQQLVKALPKMAKAAATEQLYTAILDHLEETKTQVQRLEQVFGLLGKKPQAKKCDAMEGLNKEGEGIVESTDQGTPARDLGIIMASQKVEHYEIATYTGLVKLAGKLALPDVADLLSASLAEEQAADEKLGDIADNGIDINEDEA